MANFARNLQRKRDEYFKCARTVPLENIRYDNLQVKRNAYEDDVENYSSDEEILPYDSDFDDIVD